MRAIDHRGGPDAQAMRLVELERPRPAAGEILIETAYAGVNRPDVLQRAGAYPPPAEASWVLGLEVSGRVVGLGEGVDEWQLGDCVAALVPGGGYAEYCVAPAAHALRVPTGVDMALAAALPETWFTVWANLVDMGRLKQGERVLIHGGSSGIGLSALQLARYLGAETFVTAGGAEKTGFCREFGANHAIDYRQEDFVERVREITQGEGVDVILDMVGGDYLQKDVRLLRRDGRLLLIAFLSGSKVNFDFMPVMMKRLTITGSTMRSRTRAEKAAIRDALQTSVWPALMAGELRTHVDTVFSLEQTAQAHQWMESGQLKGKIVLQVAD